MDQEMFEVQFPLKGKLGLKTFGAYVYGLDNQRALIFMLTDPEGITPPALIGKEMSEYLIIMAAKEVHEEAKLNAKLYSKLDLKIAFEDGILLGDDESKINYEDFDSWFNNMFKGKK